MKALIYLVLVSIILNSQLLFSQKDNAIKINIDGKYLKKDPDNNKIVCPINSIVTIRINTSNLKEYNDGKFKLILLPTTAETNTTYSLAPVKIDENHLEFYLSNFKQESINHYRIVYCKDSLRWENQENTVDTIIINNDSISITAKKKYDYSEICNENVIRNYFIDAHNTYHLQLSIGAYVTNAHFPVFALENMPGEDYSYIRDVGPKSTQGLLVGGTFFITEHDDKCFKNPGNTFLENYLWRPLGLFLGMGLSSESKGIDNFMIGLNYGINNLNFIAGINHLKVNTLNYGFNINEKYKVQDISKITSSKFIGHLFIGITINASVITTILGTLLTVAF